MTETEARAIFAQGEEVVVFALLTLAKMAASKQNATGADSPSTPSGMKATFLKPPVKKRNKKPGRPKGHHGERRPTPTKIDQRVEHRLDVCPGCGGPLQRCQETRTRIIEDIPEIIEPVVTEHTIHRDYCPTCKKQVEPKVPDALPGSQIGLRVLVLTAWLHSAPATTSAAPFHLPSRQSGPRGCSVRCEAPDRRAPAQQAPLAMAREAWADFPAAPIW